MGEEGRGRERDIQSRVISRGAARWPLGIELVDLRINLFCSRRYSAENGMSAWCAEKMSLLSGKKERCSFFPTYLPLPPPTSPISPTPYLSYPSYLSSLLSLLSLLSPFSFILSHDTRSNTTGTLGIFQLKRTRSKFPECSKSPLS